MADDSGSMRRSIASPGKHIPALDGVRGVAILMVLWGHFAPSFFAQPPRGWRVLLDRFLNAGWAGVDLFFVLSGFLITGILLEAKRAGSDAVRPAEAALFERGHRPPAVAYFTRFYARRILRIFPLYYAVITAVAIVTALVDNPRESAVWRNWAPWVWLFAGNVYTAQHGWLAGPNGLRLTHLWSLAVEEQFYLIWPIIVYASRPRVLGRSCFAFIAFAIGLRFYVECVTGSQYAATMLMPCRIDAFAVGGLLSVHLMSSPGNLTSDSPHCARLARRGAVMAGTSACLLVPMFLSWTWMDVVGRTVLSVFFGGVLLLAMFSPLRQAFELTLLRLFGKYSYGIYVLHFLLYRGITQCFPAARYGVVAHFAGCTAFSFALAWCSWHAFEKHFIKLKQYVPLLGKSEGNHGYCGGSNLAIECASNISNDPTPKARK